MAEMDEGLQRKYDRLRSLLNAGNVDAPHIQIEIEDLRNDIRGNDFGTVIARAGKG